jgi:hypothetical protein
MHDAYVSLSLRYAPPSPAGGRGVGERVLRIFIWLVT